jgi:hypothetical protein
MFQSNTLPSSWRTERSKTKARAEPGEDIHTQVQCDRFMNCHKGLAVDQGMAESQSGRCGWDLVCISGRHENHPFTPSETV